MSAKEEERWMSRDRIHTHTQREGKRARVKVERNIKKHSAALEIHVI